MSAGDLFQHTDTRVACLLSGYVAATAARCRGYDRVVVAQDTTYFTYGQKQIVGLGPLNGSAKGMIGHGALALSPVGVALGVVALRLWGGTANERPDCPLQIEPEVVRCESAKWEVTLANVQSALPEGTSVQVVADRESDVTSLLRAARVAAVALPAVSATRHRPEQPVVALWAVEAVKQDLAAGGEPLRWLLLTTLPVGDLAATAQLLDDYTLRWTIERLHYTLKSGLKAECL